MASALPGSGAKCPSRVSRACGPGYRFVPWAGTGPRRAGSERLAVREGSAHRTGTRLGAGGRVGAEVRVAGCLQGPEATARVQSKHGRVMVRLETPSRRGRRSRPPPSRPTSMRPPHPHKAQGLALPEEAVPFSRFQEVAGSWPEYAGSPPASPWAPSGTGWATATGSTRFPLPACPPRPPLRPAGIRHECGPLPGPERPMPPQLGGSEPPHKWCLQNPCLQTQNLIKKKKK